MTSKVLKIIGFRVNSLSATVRLLHPAAAWSSADYADVVRLNWLLAMEIEKAYALPANAGQLRSRHGTAGFDADGILCWTLVKSELSVWPAEQREPMVTSASLPHAVPRALVSTLAVKVSRTL